MQMLESIEPLLTLEVPKCHKLRQEVEKLNENLEEALKSVRDVIEGKWSLFPPSTLDKAKKANEKFHKSVEKVVQRKVREDQTQVQPHTSVSLP